MVVKKIHIFIAIAMAASAAMAQNWGLFTDDRSDITIGGTSSPVWSEADGGNQFGTVGSPMDYGIVSSLILSEFNIWTWANTAAGGSVTGGDFSYRIDGGSLQMAHLTVQEALEDSFLFERWGFSGESIDLASGLSDGPHTFSFSTTVYGESDPPDFEQDNDDGNDYFGTFEVQAVPEPATMSLLGLGALAMVLRRKIRK